MPHSLKLASFVIFWYLAAPPEKVIKFSSTLMLLSGNCELELSEAGGDL